MTDVLHLLRPFSGWVYRFGPRKNKPIETIDDAVAWVNMVRNAGFDRFSTTTARRPKRLIELPTERWGSVYFVQRKHTIFRMKLKEIVEYPFDVDIVMAPEVHRCERKHVGMVRGWRYCDDANAPRDISAEVGRLPDWYLEGA